jgi:pimeloyl-ACP methyl ester carboxylesterase
MARQARRRSSKRPTAAGNTFTSAGTARAAPARHSRSRASQTSPATKAALSFDHAAVDPAALVTAAFVHLGPGAPDVPAQADTYWYEFTLDVAGTKGRAEFVLGDHAAALTTDGEQRVPARDFEEDAYMTRALYDDLGAVLDGERASHPSDLDSAVAVHETVEAAMRSALESRAVAPGEQPPTLGEPTTERLRRRLLGQAPVSVSTLLYRDRPREAVLAELADLGVRSVDLWAFSEFATHFDPETESAEAVRADLERHGIDVPVVTFFDEEPVELSSIAVPSLVLYGEHEPPYLRRHVATFRAELADAVVREVPGAGHASNLDNPGFFTEAPGFCRQDLSRSFDRR